jgi:nitrile hydratase
MDGQYAPVHGRGKGGQMDGIHDLGGMHGFGPIPQAPGDAESQTPWERTVQGLFRAALARRLLNLDEFRHGIERMAPSDYLTSSYYERWYRSVERILVEKSLVTEAELTATTGLLDQQAGMVSQSREELASGAPRQGASRQFRRDGPAPSFSVGDRVVTRNMHPTGHTRLPRYARGKRGIVERVHGVFVFPDTNAHGLGEQPQAVYSVQFDAHELWGADSELETKVSLDLWESYLEPVRERPRTEEERSQRK